MVNEKMVRFVRHRDEFNVGGDADEVHFDLAEEIGLQVRWSGPNKAEVVGLDLSSDEVDMGFAYGNDLLGNSSTFDIPRIGFGREDKHPARQRSQKLWQARKKS